MEYEWYVSYGEWFEKIVDFDGLGMYYLASYRFLRPRLHEQIKQLLSEQIRPGLLHTDRNFGQLWGFICSCNAA